MSTELKVNTHAVYNAVWEVNFQPAAVKLIALAYAKFADPDGSNVFPGRATIMAMTGYGVDAVRDATDYLVSVGALRVVREHTATQPRRYAFSFDVLHCLATCAEARMQDRKSKREGGGLEPTGVGAPEGSAPRDRGARTRQSGGLEPTQPSRHRPGRAKGGSARPPADAGGGRRPEHSAWTAV